MAGQPARILAGDSHPQLAEAVARELHADVVPLEIDTFADGESRIQIGGSVRNQPVIVVQPTCPPVNDNVVKLALLVDAARVAGASWVAAVVPYFGYARQERTESDGEPRSAQVVARLMGAVGIDQLVAMDLHAPALESALPMPVVDVQPDVVFLPWLESRRWDRLTVVSPDAGALHRAQQYAMTLEAELAAIAKARPQADRPRPLQVLGEARDHRHRLRYVCPGQAWPASDSAA